MKKASNMHNTHQITPQQALQRVIEHREIFHDEMLHIMRLIMGGEMSPVMMAAIIAGRGGKKETGGEVTAAAQGRGGLAPPVAGAAKTPRGGRGGPGVRGVRLRRDRAARRR